MDVIWQQVKAYFLEHDGSSNPWQFRNDLCANHCLPTHSGGNSRSYHGLEINTEMMRLFASIGHAIPPQCECSGLDELSAKIEGCIELGSQGSASDYTLHTGKNDTSVRDVIMFALRDAVQFWSLWNGSTRPRIDRWKILYIAFTTCCDDICIPPQDLRDGTFRILGHSLSSMLDGLLRDGMSQDDTKYLEMLLLRESISQYLEKVHPPIQDFLRGKTTLMTRFRVRTANGEGAALAVLAAKVDGPLVPYYDLVELAGIGVCLSMDVAKEALGILRGEPTETVAGGDREELKGELRCLLDRTMQALKRQPDSHLLNWFAVSGLLLPSFMDRYRERLSQTRVELTAGMQEQIRLVCEATSGVGAE